MEADFLFAYSTAPGTDTHTNAFCEYQIKSSARFFSRQGHIQLINSKDNYDVIKRIIFK